jgi:hypothetical protein
MTKAARVAAIDSSECLAHLCNGHSVTCIQGVLDDRLFGTASAPKGGLDGRIATQAGVTFDHAMSSGQDCDESVIQLVDRRIANGFLADLDGVPDWTKQVELLNLQPQDGQACAWGALPSSPCARLDHGDQPPGEIWLFLQKWLITVSLSSFPATNSGEI